MAGGPLAIPKEPCTVNEMYDGSANPYGTVYSKRELKNLFCNFEFLDMRIGNFQGEEVSPRYGGRISRNVWLATAGKVAGLGLYFTRAIK
jgi:hypothetical protein